MPRADEIGGERVAADAVFDADHVDEPAHVHAGARRRQRGDAVDAAQAFGVHRGHGFALLQQFVEAAELRQADGGAQLVEAIVVAER